MRSCRTPRSLHNRSKSESALFFSAAPNITPFNQQIPISVTTPAANTVTPVPSLSNVTALATLGEYLQSLASEVSGVTSKSFHKRISDLESDVTGLHCSQVSHSVTEHITFLKQERAQLNATIQTLLKAITELGEDVSTIRCELHDALRQGTSMRQQVKADENEIKKLREQIVQYSKFIGLLVDFGLQEAVFFPACTAFLACHNVDEALVDSIQQIATNLGSPWSKIIAAITSVRTSDEYLSAIHMSLNLRQQSKDSKPLIKFRKRTTKQYAGGNISIITPFPANVSSVQEDSGYEKQNAIDELLPQTIRQWRTNVGAPEHSIAPSSVENTVACLTPFGQSSVSHETSITDCGTTCNIVSDSESCTSSSTVRPYFAGNSFNDDLCATNSDKRILPLNSNKTTQRIPLGKLDINRELKVKRSSNRTSELKPIKVRPKNRGKRRAIVISQSAESIEKAIHLTHASAGLAQAAQLSKESSLGGTLTNERYEACEEGFLNVPSSTPKRREPSPRPLNCGSVGFFADLFVEMDAIFGDYQRLNDSQISLVAAPTIDGDCDDNSNTLHPVRHLVDEEAGIAFTNLHASLPTATYHLQTKPTKGTASKFIFPKISQVAPLAIKKPLPPSPSSRTHQAVKMAPKFPKLLIATTAAKPSSKATHVEPHPTVRGTSRLSPFNFQRTFMPTKAQPSSPPLTNLPKPHNTINNAAETTFRNPSRFPILRSTRSRLATVSRKISGGKLGRAD